MAEAMRDLLYVSASGTQDVDSDEITDWIGPGWRIRFARDPASAAAILESRPRRQFTGLLDLRGSDDPALLGRLEPLLTVPHVSWVAAIHSDQLRDEGVRIAIRRRCYDYVTLPCPERLLRTVIGHAYGLAALDPVTQAVAIDADTVGMIGNSQPMRALYRAIRRAAASDAPVLIEGETGTGKELAARAIHDASARRDRPFVAINCGAIPEHLVQSELFGYERGAFTGAQQRKLGRIELAQGGTLFLDEIGDLPLETQASLLRFLQEGQIERLGGHDTIAIDARIVSATHVDLAASVARGSFRRDLFHRLCVLNLQQPPLRERGNDILQLAAHALQRYAGEAQRPIRGFSPCALRALQANAWPGNVRELVNRVRQAVVMAEGRYITARDLRIALDDVDAPLPTLDAVRDSATRDAIERALQRNRGRLVDTARDLAVSRVTLYRLLERLGLRSSELSTQDSVSAA
jgi:DNA-binding NtrC family response regulator